VFHDDFRAEDILVWVVEEEGREMVDENLFISLTNQLDISNFSSSPTLLSLPSITLTIPQVCLYYLFSLLM